MSGKVTVARVAVEFASVAAATLAHLEGIITNQELKDVKEKLEKLEKENKELRDEVNALKDENESTCSVT